MDYPSKLTPILKRQKYHIIGNHSSVKKCKWLHESLVNDRVCYKEKFYGIKSHRCIQMTPMIFSCLTHCIYCWRVLPEDLGVEWNEEYKGRYDDPDLIVENCIKEQRRILSGYNDQVIKGKVSEKKYEESLNPNMVAISLLGEPTLYPFLNELIGYLKKRKYASFLVTSGLLPGVLKKLSNEPSQLYISLTAADFNSYMKINRPLSPKLWDSLMGSLELLKSFNCPTAIRITVIDGMNTDQVDKFSKLIALSDPTYVEVKAYMHLGYSLRRLDRTKMPSFVNIKKFGNQLALKTGFNLIDESIDSRVVLLSKLKKTKNAVKD